MRVDPNWYADLYPDEKDRTHSVEYIRELDADLEIFISYNEPNSWKGFLKMRKGRKHVS